MKVTLSVLNVFFFLFGTGKNIYISHDVQTILEFIDEQSQGFVVQKYIENPLLLDGNRKFDIRFDLLLNLYFNTMVQHILHFCLNQESPQSRL